MKQIVLHHTLTAKPRASDFALVISDAPPCPDGGVLARVVYLSLDPYIGSRLRGRHMGEPAPRPGVDAIPGGVVAQVIESRAQRLRVGDWVHSMGGGWAEIVALAPGQARRIDPALAPLSAHAGVLGMPGLTAWAGITQLAMVRTGDVVLIDAAAGPVGGTAGQIARMCGARAVIGLAGGAKKCALVSDVYGFDACIDYTSENWHAALDAALPSPPTVIFENVGVPMLVAALQRAAPYARAVLCGLVDQYHADAPPPQIPAGLVIGKRAQLLGLVVYDFYPRFEEYVRIAARWIANGRLKTAEDRATGLEAAPALFERLMDGNTIGKALVQVAEEAGA